MENRMQNVKALVTGGASGIGKAVASRIIRHGGQVMIIDVNPAGEEVAASLGKRAKFMVVDITSEKDVTEALERTKQLFGQINVLVTAAAIAAIEPFYDFETKKPHSSETWKRIMEVNVFGTFNVVRLAAGVMAENTPDENNQRGVIVNFSSIFSEDCPGGIIAYGVSKGAVGAMTIPMARALAPKGIRVVAIAPGFTRTPMAAGAGDKLGTVFPSLDAMLLSPIREAEPEEMAHAIQFIIENPFANGRVIRIDAGYHFVSPSVTN